MPLPPSTSGSTSRPEITSGFSAITSRLLSLGGHPSEPRLPSLLGKDAGARWRGLLAIGQSGNNAVGAIREHGSKTPAEQFARPRGLVHRISQQRIPVIDHRACAPPSEIPLIAVNGGAAEPFGPHAPIGWKTTEEMAAGDLRRHLARRI